MYLLNNTPIFSEFIKRFCRFAGYEFKNHNFYNNLFLYAKCNCGQKDCATVYLKSKNPFKEEVQRIDIIETNKGFFFVHILDNGYFDFEALRYNFYPYKKEIDTYFSKRKKIDKKILIKRIYTKKLSKKEKVNLHKYFWNLEFKEPNIIDLGEVNI